MTMEDNKLIAEFMGVKPTKSELGRKIYYDSHEDKYVGLDLQYDTSWDWLMPVVRKIEDGGLDPHELIDKALESRLIEDAYNEVVDTIKRYNESNKMDTLPTSIQQG